MNELTLPIKGGCACKLIRYECSANPLDMINCHCRDCQYASGTNQNSVFVMQVDDVTITGKPKYYESVSLSGNKVHRGFCPECGSPLFAGNDAHSQYIAIKAASLDDPSWFQPTADFWTSSAQPWDIMGKDTEKFEKGFVE